MGKPQPMELPEPERPFYVPMTDEQVALRERMIRALPETGNGTPSSLEQ